MRSAWEAFLSFQERLSFCGTHTSTCSLAMQRGGEHGCHHGTEEAGAVEDGLLLKALPKQRALRCDLATSGAFTARVAERGTGTF